MVASLGHRVKYGNLEVGNTTQQFLSTTEHDHAAVLSLLNHFCFESLSSHIIGIYICLYIYKVSYIHYLFVIFNCNVFSPLHAKHSEI